MQPRGFALLAGHLWLLDTNDSCDYVGWMLDWHRQMAKVITRPRLEDPDAVLTADEMTVAVANDYTKALDESGGEPIRVVVGGREIPIVGGLEVGLARLSRYLSRPGRAVTIVPYNTELTSQGAADILGISRTRLLQLIERGDLEARFEGAHRRLRLENVLAYREDRVRKQRNAARRIRSLSTKA